MKPKELNIPLGLNLSFVFDDENIKIYEGDEERKFVDGFSYSQFGEFHLRIKENVDFINPKILKEIEEINEICKGLEKDGF